MISNNTIDAFYNAKKQLTLLEGKRPVRKDWPRNPATDEEIANHHGNLGWVIDECSAVLDVDPRNGGDDSFSKLENAIGIKLSPTVNTPSGGFHIYLSLPPEYHGARFRKNHDSYPGIDFLTIGSQCVIPGSEVNGKTYRWAHEGQCFMQEAAPKSLLALFLRQEIVAPADDLESRVGGKSATTSPERIHEALLHLDPSMGYHDWLNVGMALHDWDPLNGLSVWEDWSAGGENYEEGATKQKWRSFEVGGGITVGTLFKMEERALCNAEVERRKRMIERIGSADEHELNFDLVDEIRNEKFDIFNQSAIETAYQNRQKALTGAKPKIADVRALLEPPQDMAQLEYDDQYKELFKPYVFVSARGEYMNFTTGETFSAAAFNQKFGQFLPVSQNGGKAAATKFTADRGLIQVVNSTSYMPTIPDRFFEMDGITRLNTFNPNSIPPKATSITKEGQQVIDHIITHTRLLFGEGRYEIFLQWLAHQVQHPGELLQWAVLLQSKQGLGKSFIGELLRACLGHQNVGVVAPMQVMDRFNGWATNVAVNVFEELRIEGHNRFVTMNALKPLVTDRHIQINEKNVKAYKTFNTANIIAFTNHTDAMPLDQDDRRWWVIFAPFASIADFEEVAGMGHETYFSQLYGGLYEHAPEVHKWLSEYPISADFKAIKRAPMTEEKQSMIVREQQNINGFIEAQECIATGAVYYDQKVVSSSHLFDEIYIEFGVQNLSNQQKHRILRKLGFDQHPQLVKVDGKPLRIWTRQPMTNKEIRQHIDVKQEEEL